MTTSRNALMKELEAIGLNVAPSEDFDGHKGGIWVRNSEDACSPDDLPYFDFYAESNLYTMGVHHVLYYMLEEAGWHAEPNDPGTYLIWN